MLDTEREAKRLMSDPSSWSQGGIRHKAFRQMQLTPDEEVPRHKTRQGKKRHKHDWAESGTTITWGGKTTAMYVCRVCGNKSRSRWV